MHTLPAGPTVSPVTQALRFGQDPYAFLAECARTYGDVFTVRLPNEAPTVVLTAPEDIRWFFALKPEDYVAARINVPVNLGDTSLLFLDGDVHRRERQLLLPPLHGERLLAHTRAMHTITDAALDRLVPGRTVRVHEVFQRVGLAVITECVFGVRGDREELETELLAWLEGAFSPQVFAAGIVFSAARVRRFLEGQVARRRGARRRGAWLPWRRLADHKVRILELLQAEVDRARAETRAPDAPPRTDALSLLLDARYADGSAMTDEHILTELVTLLIGGHETTSSTLAWTVDHLLRQPALLARVHAELDAAFGATGFDPARCGQLPLLEACIQEAMRLTPIAPAVSRYLARDLVVRGYTVPAGTILWAGVGAAHRRPDTWPEPDAYRPDRFLQGKPALGEFLPFGGGRRLCIGMAFAQHEMRIVLARFLHRVRATPAAPPARPVFRGITLAPMGGVPLTIDEVLPR